jgi:hypothetical protein
MKLLLTEQQFNNIVDNLFIIENNINIYKNLEGIQQNKDIGLSILINECQRFDNYKDLLKSSGFSDFGLNLFFYGFTENSVKQLYPKDIKIKWKDDLENVYYEIRHSKLTPKEWSKKINLTEPVDVIFENNNFFLDDGHHRYVAAKTLKKQLNVNLDIRNNPFKIIKSDYDSFHKTFFEKYKSHS